MVIIDANGRMEIVMKDFTNSDKLFGVACDVVNCKFHGTDNYCHADEIVVESENALRKAETFCGTFTPKGASM